jgi:hypothetical protein
MSKHKCHRMHDILPSPMDLQPQICFVCTAQFMPNYQSLTCHQCHQSICLECVLLYTPETAFPMHLANYAEATSLKCYTNNKECATQLMRDPYLAPVYYEYQRFYNTDEYIQLLEERITNTKHEIECIKMELQNTQNRLSSNKIELINARQRKRLDTSSTS